MTRTATPLDTFYGVCLEDTKATSCPCCYSGRTAVVRMPWNGYHEVCDACGYTWHRAENELGDDCVLGRIRSHER